MPHRSSTAARVALAAIAGLLVHVAVGTGTPRLAAAALAIAALGTAVRGLGSSRAAAVGLVAGLIGCLAMLGFVLEGVELAGLSRAHGAAALTLAALLHGARFALAAAIAAALTRRGVDLGLAIAGGWLLAEVLDPAPLPWSLGAATLQLPPLAAAADIGGPVAAALIPCLLGALALDLAVCAWRSAAVAGALLVALSVHGVARTAAIDASASAAPRLRVAAVHGVRRRGHAGTAPVEERRAAEVALAAGASLIALPEGALQVSRAADVEDGARAVFGDLAAAVAVGVVTGDGTRNAIVLVEPGGRARVRDKRRPFPGGEDRRGPFAWLGAPAGAVDEGRDQPPIEVAGPPGGLRVATAVCWDDLFAIAAADAADVIVVAANDGWFEGTAAAEAHLLQARLLAVAARRPMIRATNLGATAIVDAVGRVLARADASRVAVADVAVGPH